MSKELDTIFRAAMSKRLHEVMRTERERIWQECEEAYRSGKRLPNIPPAMRKRAQTGTALEHHPTLETQAAFWDLAWRLLRYQEACGVPNSVFARMFPTLRHPSHWSKMANGNFGKHHPPQLTLWLPVLQQIVDTLNAQDAEWVTKRLPIQSSEKLLRAELRALAWRAHLKQKELDLSDRELASRYGDLIGSRFTFTSRLLAGDVSPSTIEDWLGKLRRFLAELSADPKS